VLPSEAAPTRDTDTIKGRVLREPADLLPRTLVDKTARQSAALLGLENLLENVLFAGPRRDKGYL